MVSKSESKVRTVLRVVTGNFLEMYDFMIFGYYASAIGQKFFPSQNAFTSLMLSLVTFGAGFVMRPLGAIFLGSYIDRCGRRKGLVLTLGLMALGTFTLAVTPGYATLGLLAPLLIVLGRLIQGFSAGVELGGVSVYLSEIATPKHKGFYVSFQSASQQLAVAFSASVGFMLSSYLSKSAMDDWGWRIPILLGCFVIPVFWMIRRSLPETEAFLAQHADHRPKDSREVFRALLKHWRVIFRGVLLVTMSTVTFYVITAYTPTFGRQLNLADKDTLLVTLCVGISNLLLLPLMGALSDKIGRRPILLTCTILAMATAYPAMRWLALDPTFGHLLTVSLWLSVIYASYNGAAIVFLTEIMPAEIRTSSFSLAYSIAVALFGGFTPAICGYLIYATHSRAMPGVWLSFAALCGFLASLRPQTSLN